MKVKIVKSDSLYTWYAKSVGNTYDVEKLHMGGTIYYGLINDHDYIIRIEDAEPVPDMNLPEFPKPDGNFFIDEGHSTASVRTYSDKLITIINELRQELDRKTDLTAAVEQQTLKVAALLRHYERSAVDGVAIVSSTTA